VPPLPSIYPTTLDRDSMKKKGMQRVTAVGVTASVRQWRAEAEPVRQCRDTCSPNNAPSMSFPALGIAVGAMGVHVDQPRHDVP
jgi:hypothetical protein